MTNEPERSIEEIVEEFSNEWERIIDCSGTVRAGLDDWLTQTLQTERQRCEEMVEREWYIGKKIHAFGGEYVVVGISTMIYDKDCEGEPEWKITKEVQEVAIAKEYDDISYQKPSWHNVQTLTQPTPLDSNKLCCRMCCSQNHEHIKCTDSSRCHCPCHTNEPPTPLTNDKE